MFYVKKKVIYSNELLENDVENLKSYFVMYKSNLKHDYNNTYSILIVRDKKYMLVLLPIKSC